MNPPIHQRFAPSYNVSALLQDDRVALAHQLHLCHTARSGWRRMSASTEGVQAFAAQHLISMLMAIFVVISMVSWLME